ncbi:hypothetical protein EJ07DRAFT_179250 [Lizonia empirigonia]|nr:hypothetical protein EJ07DRAFT_179250 [Lizonia empirigonia]
MLLDMRVRGGFLYHRENTNFIGVQQAEVGAVGIAFDKAEGCKTIYTYLQENGADTPDPAPPLDFAQLVALACPTCGLQFMGETELARHENLRGCNPTTSSSDARQTVNPTGRMPSVTLECNPVSQERPENTTVIQIPHEASHSAPPLEMSRNSINGPPNYQIMTIKNQQGDKVQIPVDIPGPSELDQYVADQLSSRDLSSDHSGLATFREAADEEETYLQPRSEIIRQWKSNREEKSNVYSTNEELPARAGSNPDASSDTAQQASRDSWQKFDTRAEQQPRDDSSDAIKYPGVHHPPPPKATTSRYSVWPRSPEQRREATAMRQSDTSKPRPLMQDSPFLQAHGATPIMMQTLQPQHMTPEKMKALQDQQTQWRDQRIRHQEFEGAPGTLALIDDDKVKVQGSRQISDTPQGDELNFFYDH